MLEKNGVQINLLIAGKLDGLEYGKLLNKVEKKRECWRRK